MPRIKHISEIIIELKVKLILKDNDSIIDKIYDRNDNYNNNNNFEGTVMK